MFSQALLAKKLSEKQVPIKMKSSKSTKNANRSKLRVNEWVDTNCLMN